MRRRNVLDDMIGKGGIRVPDIQRPYTQLSDDPRVLHYEHMSPDTWRELRPKLAVARRYHDEVRFAAMKGDRT